MKTNNNLCTVCKKDHSPFFPWGEDGLAPSYEICTNCGVQWGYEDATEIGLKNYQEQYENSQKKKNINT